MSPSKLIEDDLNNNNATEEKKRLFPYKIEKVSSETNAELLSDFSGERSYFVQVGPKKYFFPSNYEQDAEKFYNFEVRPDDIWIVTFPRSGTTWTQELIWLLANDLDYQTARDVPLNTRCPFLEFSTFFHPKVKEEFLKKNEMCPDKVKLIEEVSRKEWQHLQLRNGRRIIKTHLPFTLLPQNLLRSGCKVVYLARNPKDVIISFYHLNKLFRTQGYGGDLRKYWYYFKRNLQPWTPYWEHLQEGWERRLEENLLFMFYENIKIDSKTTIVKVATFLDKELTGDELDRLNDHLKIENFKNNPSVNSDILKELGIIRDVENGFIRKGKVGGWQDELDEDLNEEIDRWIKENLEKTDFRFSKHDL